MEVLGPSDDWREIWIEGLQLYPQILSSALHNQRLPFAIWWNMGSLFSGEDERWALVHKMTEDEGQEATVRTGYGKTDWFQIGKGVRQGCILSPCLFNLCAEYIMRNAGLDESQARIKIARRNINNLRYADDTTLMAESKEKQKTLLMKMKEESDKVGFFKIQHSENEDHGIWSHHFMANRWGKQWKQWEALFLGAPKSMQLVTAALKLKDVCSLEEELWPT